MTVTLDDELLNIQFETTGRSAYAFMGIVGVPIRGDFRLYYGFDGEIEEFASLLSPEEKRELADTMIARWQEYRDSL